MADKVAKKAITGIGNSETFVDKDGNIISKGKVIAPRSMQIECERKEDFFGDLIGDEWSAAAGNDAQAAVATVIPGATAGWIRLTSGDTTTVSESLSAITHGLNWKASNGGLELEVRFLPVSAVTTVAYFVGFTDTLATTTLEEPITLSGTTFTTNATDAVGFVYDTAATTDNWYAMGVKNGTDATAVDTGYAPTVGVDILRIAVNKDGDAYFYIDGVEVGVVEDAITPTVSITPIVSVMARTTTSRSVDVDYIAIKMDRV